MVMETGCIKAVTKHVGNETLLDGGPGLSFPVPIVKEDTIGKQLLLAYFYFYTIGTGNPLETPDLDAPEYVAKANLHTREIVDYHPVTSKDFGIDRDDTQPLGKHDLTRRAEEKLGKKVTMDDFLEMESRFYQRYDRILPLFENTDQALSNEQKQAVSEFSNLFSILAHELLHPYYRALNPAFFDWLKQNSQ